MVLAICIVLEHRKHMSVPMLPASCSIFAHGKRISVPMLPATCSIFAHWKQFSVPMLPAADSVRDHPACYLHSFYAVQHAVRYPPAPVRYLCCLLRTAFGTHSACYLHSFCTHCNMPFGTQGPRSAPKGSKLRDPYRKSRLPLWPVNNLTAKVGGTGPGWRLIQDHQHSIVWGARPPKWCLFPPITPPSSPITLSAWLFITMPIPSSGVVCVCACISPHENYAVQLGLCACVLAFVRTKIMQCNCTHARVATLN